MLREKFWIDENPTGSSYSELIDFCSKRCPKFTFVMQQPQQFSKECYHFLGTLEQQLIEVINQAEWPGTKLSGFSAPVYWYRVTPDLVDRIKGTVSGLFDWLVPDLPEDLAFYWPDGLALLGTTSHERFAFVNLGNSDLQEFRKEVPNVRLSRNPSS